VADLCEPPTVVGGFVNLRLRTDWLGAHVAALLGAPVVLVVDARGQSRSLAALLHGFRSFDPGDGRRARLAGVVRAVRPG